jgi:hypothetical protein
VLSADLSKRISEYIDAGTYTIYMYIFPVNKKKETNANVEIVGS